MARVAKTEFAKFREQVTNELIAAMEAGTAPWQRPWAPNSSMPFNAVGKNRYRGGNAIYLAFDMIANGFSDPRYLTIAQAAKLGEKDRGEPYALRDGERAKFRTVEFWKLKQNGRPTVGDLSEPDGEKPEVEETSKTSRFPLIWRGYKVYHVSQFDGIPPLPQRELTWSPIERAEQLIAASGADVRFGGNRASFDLVTDTIRMPAKSQFDTPEAFYSTALHELSHWTGTKTRTRRHETLGLTVGETDSPNFTFGDTAYAKEELVAELSSVFLCAEVGVPHNPEQHAAYLQSWIDVLKEDRNALFRAASDASRAADFILDLEIDRSKDQPLEPSVAAMVTELAPGIVTETEVAAAAQLIRFEVHAVGAFEWTARGEATAIATATPVDDTGRRLLGDRGDALVLKGDLARWAALHMRLGLYEAEVRGTDIVSEPQRLAVGERLSLDAFRDRIGAETLERLPYTAKQLDRLAAAGVTTVEWPVDDRIDRIDHEIVRTVRVRPLGELRADLNLAALDLTRGRDAISPDGRAPKDGRLLEEFDNLNDQLDDIGAAQDLIDNLRLRGIDSIEAPGIGTERIAALLEFAKRDLDRDQSLETRAERVAQALTRTASLHERDTLEILAANGFADGSFRRTDDASDILLDRPLIVSWNGGTRWDVLRDEALYAKLESELTADVVMGGSMDASLKLDATPTEKRVALFLAKLDERPRSNAELWSLALNEIKGLKDELEMKTVRRELTEYRKAVAERDPEHPILVYLRPSRADQEVVAEEARERALGDLRKAIKTVPAPAYIDVANRLLVSTDYFEKMAGLMAATGRRSTELAKTGTLVAVDPPSDTHLAWHVRDDEQSAPGERHVIPTVGDAKLVLAAFNDVRAARDFSAAEGREINQALAAKVGAVVKREFAAIGMEITPKDLRPAYAAVAFGQHGRQQLVVDFNADILQHDRNNAITAFNNVKFVSSVVPATEMAEQIAASHAVLTERTVERLHSGLSEVARVNTERELKHLGWLDVAQLVPSENAPADVAEVVREPDGGDAAGRTQAQRDPGPTLHVPDSVAAEMRGWGYTITPAAMTQTTGKIIKDLDGHVVQDIGRSVVRIVAKDAFDGAPPAVGDVVTIAQDRESGRCSATKTAEQEVEIAR